MYSTSLKSENAHKWHWSVLNLFLEQKAEIIQCPVKNQIPGQSGITCPSTHVSLAPQIPSSFGCSELELVLTVFSWKTMKQTKWLIKILPYTFLRHECFFEILKDTVHFLEAHLKGYLNTMFPYMDKGITFCEFLGGKVLSL